MESLVFKEDGCVSVRDTARDVIFVDYLKVEIEMSVVETIRVIAFWEILTVLIGKTFQ